MLLYRLEDVNPNYHKEIFERQDIKGLDVYAGNTDEKIGTVNNALVDETGRIRYLVIETGFWIFGKKVLLPVGLSRFETDANRVYAKGITSKAQVEKLPRYEDGIAVDYDYEEQVRGVFRTPTVEGSVPVEVSLPLETPRVVATSTPIATPTPVSKEANYAPQEAPRVVEPSALDVTPIPIANEANYARDNRNTYTYEQEPSLYQMNDLDRKTLRLYEERLIADKSRRKTGEVTIGKRVEVETARTSIPVEKERVVIERIIPESAGTPITPKTTAFQEGEAVHLEVYEETADIKKQAFVREEVNLRKEVDRDTVEATETLRHEELDVETQGSVNVNKSNLPPQDR